jgi:hypothetical protein
MVFAVIALFFAHKATGKIATNKGESKSDSKAEMRQQMRVDCLVELRLNLCLQQNFDNPRVGVLKLRPSADIGFGIGSPMGHARVTQASRLGHARETQGTIL